MANVPYKKSDLDDKKIAPEEEFAIVTVRQHPKLDQPKQFDVHVDEVKLFKALGDLVILEVKMPDGNTKDVCMSLVEFNKIGDNMDDVVKNGRGIRGRVPGTRMG